MATLKEMRAAMPPGWEQGITFEGILEALEKDMEARDITRSIRKVIEYSCSDMPRSHLELLLNAEAAKVVTSIVEAALVHYYEKVQRLEGL